MCTGSNLSFNQKISQIHESKTVTSLKKWGKRKTFFKEVLSYFGTLASLRFFQSSSFFVEIMAIAAIIMNDAEATSEDIRSICCSGWTCLWPGGLGEQLQCVRV